MLIHWYRSATSHRNRNSCRWYWCGCKRLQIRTVLVEVSVHSNELISCPESAWTWMLNCWKWRRRYCKWLENAYDSCLKVKVSCWNVSWNYQVWTIFYNEQFSVQNGDPGAPATCAAVKHRRHQEVIRFVCAVLGLSPWRDMNCFRLLYFNLVYFCWFYQSGYE